jgi:hypothetical protein
MPLRLFILVLFLCGQVHAHAVPAGLFIFLEGKQFVVEMVGSDTVAINGAKLEYILTDASGKIYRAFMSQSADGEYRADAPRVEPGVYTFAMRDTTFPGEALEVKQQVQYPLTSLKLELPASKAPASSLPTLLFLIVIPIAASLLVLIVALRRSKPKIALE